VRAAPRATDGNMAIFVVGAGLVPARTSMANRLS
jgi:hypothetical protein